jgi:hypothetical protein
MKHAFFIVYHRGVVDQLAHLDDFPRKEIQDDGKGGGADPANQGAAADHQALPAGNTQRQSHVPAPWDLPQQVLGMGG